MKNKNKRKLKTKILKIQRRRNTSFLFIFIIIGLFPSLHYKLNSKDSYITLRILDQREKKVFNENIGDRRPDKVYIDEINQITVTNTYILNSENIIKLVWTKQLTNCYILFDSCKDIVEMNLTYFNTSLVTYMVYMFRDCHNLISLDLSNIDTSSVTNMGVMFQNCYSLVSLDMSHFDTSKLTNIGMMFQDCKSLKFVNMTNFKTTKVNYLDNLFNGCTNLTSIDLSSFNTSNVITIKNMFKNCVSLTSLDISHFEISGIDDMSEVFCNCYLLTSLNISNFITTAATNMDKMFYNCASLIYLDFPNLDLSSATNINDMFTNCKNLEYINIKNYKPSNSLGGQYLFNDSPKNLVVCTEDVDLIDTIKNHECNIVNCSDNWYEYRKKIYADNGSCIEECNLTNYRYEFNSKCYSNCIKGTYNNNYKCEKCHSDCEECEGPFSLGDTNCTICSSHDKYLYFGNCINQCPRNYFYYNETLNQHICYCELEQCLTCSKESLKRHLCTSCDKNNGFFPIYDDLYNNNYPYLNCSKDLQGFYFDNEDKVYKLCYNSCKICNKSGNETEHNCHECKLEYNFEINYQYYKNCYNNCSYYHYYDKNNGISFCTAKFECPEIYDKLIEDKKECAVNCTKDILYKYEFNKRCYKECPYNSTQRENNTELQYFCKPICNKEIPFEMIYTQECIKNCPNQNMKDKTCILNYEGKIGNKSAYDIMLDNLEIRFTSEDYNTSGIEQGEDDVFYFGDIIVTLTLTSREIKKMKQKI